MDVRFVNEVRGDAIVLMATEGGALTSGAHALDVRLNGALTRAAQAARFTGGSGAVVEVLAPAGIEASRILIVGLGQIDKIDSLSIERWAGHAVKRLLTSGLTSIALVADGHKGVTAAESAARAAIGARLAAYRFDRYRTKLRPDQKPTLAELAVVTDGPAAAQARYEHDAAVVDGVHWARDLVNEPANVLYPEAFAARIKTTLEPLGVDVEILGEAEMEKLGMNALLGVGRGSARQSQIAIMSWRGAKNKAAQPLALVGKGVTFDTGGISLKPGAGMEEMKGDMGGAAAVVGAMKTLAMRKARANVVGLVGLVENMPDGEAQRPGDIVVSMSGQTIEVLNTDAEGRLVLADVVWHAQEKFNPAAVVDLATLTGAIIVSLGHEHAGLFCNDDDLAQALVSAGQAEGEAVWRMPLSPAYDKMMDSPTADMKNISGKPAAGSITGAQFIGRFIKPGMAWAHIDIAGTAWKPGPYEDPVSPSWATGYGVRLLNRLVASRYEE
ncbi:MAG: leucyl aminopeptidase [Alphaproteobacteria bacterium]|nr:leucyl aminopeptidase [Alphaproteobacteria bacterium]